MPRIWKRIQKVIDMTATLHDIAKRLGISPQTVARVLSGTNKENRPSSIKRAMAIRQLAHEMNYRPNAAARAMTSRSTRNIGVLVASKHNDPFTASEVYFSILGINDVLEMGGYVTSIVRVDEMQHQLDIRSRAAQEVVFDGVIGVGSIPASLCEPIESIFKNVIWLDTNIDMPHRCLMRDEKQVGRIIAREVIANGYQNILWVGRPLALRSGHHSHRDRVAGFQEVLEGKDISFNEIGIDWDWVESMQDLIGPFLNTQTAVIVNDANRAGLVIRAGVNVGLRPGQDYGLASCDVTPTFLHAWPDLSYVQYDRYEAGRTAGVMILGLLDESDSVCKSMQIPMAWLQGQTLPLRNRK